MLALMIQFIHNELKYMVNPADFTDKHQNSIFIFYVSNKP